MIHTIQLRACLTTLAIMLLAVPARFASADTSAPLIDLAGLVASAHPGQVVKLAAGHYRGGVKLPPGVSLKGAGFQQTIIDADGSDSGLTLVDSHDATISGLTVSNSRNAGISITQGSGLHLLNVRLTGCMMGANITDSLNPELANVLSDHNTYGVIMNGCRNGVIANCTVSDCLETGLLLPTGDGATVFNNVVTSVSTCINIGSTTNVHLDHNLYVGQFIGTMDDQNHRPLLIGWQALTGQEDHSVQLLVTFRDPANGDYTPTSTLPWALDRPTTAGWGAAQFSGIEAPVADIFGKRHGSDVCLGAFEANAKAPRRADGKLTVQRGDGDTSAGVFTPSGTLVAYLFQNLPLARGSYAYWLPPRDFEGRPVPAGAYEVRLTESRLRWQYLSHIADTGTDRSTVGGNTTAPFIASYATFLPGGKVLMGEEPSEDHTSLRCYAGSDSSVVWTMAGAYPMRGLAMGEDGYAYAMRALDDKLARLTRLDPATGNLMAWGGNGTEHARVVIGDGAGLAELGGKLYTVVGNSLATIDLASIAKDPENVAVDSTIPVASPLSPTADPTTKLLWVISGGKLVAMSGDGTVRATSSPVDDPASISAAGGQLAVASWATGKISVFDARDPAKLKLLRTVGSGDGPFGPFSTTRFLFQKSPGWHRTLANVTLDASGAMTVIDYGRVICLNADGTTRWFTYGVFGNQVHPSYATGNRRLYDTTGDRSFAIDERTGHWAPDAYWDMTSVPGYDQEWQTVFRGDFSLQGKTFGVFCAHGLSGGLTVTRFDGYRAVPVLVIAQDPAQHGQCVIRKDSNHDGVIDAKDAGELLLGPDGKPFTQLFPRFEYLQENGDILIMWDNGTIYKWHCGGLDSDGVPIYRGQDRTTLMKLDAKNFIDPYDGKPGGATAPEEATVQPSGGYTVQNNFRGSGGTGANNGAGTDLIGLDAQGNLRWFNQLSYAHGLAGLGTANGVTVTSKFDSGEFLAFDEDGLGLGGFTEAPQLHYIGIWIDHPNMYVYRGLDGHGYVTYGDNIAGRHPWYRILGDDQILHRRLTVTVTPQLAATLAALPPVSAPTEMTPPHPQIVISHLSAPFTIDGSMGKWRDAGIRPQIVFPPREGDIHKAGAVMRLAYEGQNLYVQVLEFDNHPNFCFGPICPVWQDCIEMGINGAGVDTGEHGFQYLAYRGPDAKTHVSRYKFFHRTPVVMLDPDHTPCVVNVLPDAHDLPERKALEALWGVDLSTSKVIVTEFKLPLDAQTYAGYLSEMPPLGPGKTFWFGAFVDGSAFPGEELQHLMAWPPTFGFFSPQESGATAVCE